MDNITCDPEHSILVCKNLYALYKDSKWCDIDVVINGHRYALHKLALVFNSEYLKDEIDKENQQIIVTTNENVKPEIVQSIFDYFYTGNIVGLKLDNIEGVFNLLNMLKCSENVFTYCHNYIESQINVETVFEIHVLAERLGINELVEKSKKFELDHFSEIMHVKDFINLRHDQISELLASDNLQVTSEEKAFEGLIIWYLGDRAERKLQFFCLLKCIRTPFLPRQFVVQNVLPLCEVNEIVCEFISWYICREDSSKCALNLKPRCSDYALLAVCQIRSRNSMMDYEIYKYDFVGNSWKTYMKSDKTSVAVESCPPVILNNEIFIVNQNGFWSISLRTSEITLIEPPTEFTFSGSTISVLNNRLFLSHTLKSNNICYTAVEWRNPLTRKWNRTLPMNTKRTYHATVVHNDKLFVFGGRDVKDVGLNSAEVYNPITNRWEDLPSMSIQRPSCLAVVLGDVIYIVDRNLSPSGAVYMERFDTVTKTWTGITGSKQNWLYNPLIDQWIKYKEIKTVNKYATIMLVPPEYIQKTRWKLN